MLELLEMTKTKNDYIYVDEKPSICFHIFDLHQHLGQLSDHLQTL